MLENHSFTKHFKQFIKPYNCQSHKQQPTFVCIDTKCSARGLICSICLTINGCHKNHDSVQIHDFLSLCVRAYEDQDSKDQIFEIVRQIDDAYQTLLKVLTDFHQSFSKMVKEFIAKKSELHQEKQSFLAPKDSLQQLKQCKFKSLEQLNRILNILMSRVSTTTLKVDKDSEHRLLIDTQHYLDDLTYEIERISEELKKNQNRLKDLFTLKTNSPVVITTDPTFENPTYIDNDLYTYIGEAKNNKPHGKGISFHKKSQKVIFSQFKNGEVEGNGQLYFSGGDYYIGQFRLGKKEGRGAYYWTGKDNNVYQGEFRSGKRHGRGTFWWSDGSWYEGDFKQGMQQGCGTLYRPNENKQYQGQWINGMFDGQGKQYFENGEKYQGTFEADKFHGEGVFYKNDSIIYGVWTNNELTVVNMVKSTLNEK